MNPRDWRLFLERGAGNEIACAQLLPDEVLRHLAPSNDQLFIHHDYAMKAVTKHRLGPEHFPLIFETVEYGAALADRPLHVTFLRLTDAGWFQVTVKRAEASGRLYVATFYKINAKEVGRKLKRHPILTNEKRAV